MKKMKKYSDQQYNDPSESEEEHGDSLSNEGLSNENQSYSIDGNPDLNSNSLLHSISRDSWNNLSNES